MSDRRDRGLEPALVVKDVHAGLAERVANPWRALLDGCLAAGILTALILDSVVGWWWTDPVAAGFVAVVALNEAREAWAG